jgi:uncharacterized membrane protein YvbJ
MPYCPNCGTEYQEGANFCSNCGRAVGNFDGILENNLRAAQRAKEMLVPRLQSEQE